MNSSFRTFWCGTQGDPCINERNPLTESESTDWTPLKDPTAFPEEAQDQARLAAIPSALLTETSDPVLDGITQQVSEAIGGAAFITLVLETIQFFKSGTEPTVALAACRATNRGDSFCRHVIDQERTVIIEDTTLSPLSSPRIVSAFGVGAYLGTPIRVDGHIFGALCSVHPEKKRFRPVDAVTVESLAPAVAERLCELAVPQQMVAAAPDIVRSLEVLNALISFLAEIRPALRALVLHVETATVHQLRAASEMVDEFEPLHAMLRDGVQNLREAVGGACEPAIQEIERLVIELRPLARLAEAYRAGNITPDEALDGARLLDAAAKAMGSLEIAVHTLRRALSRLN